MSKVAWEWSATAMRGLLGDAGVKAILEQAVSGGVSRCNAMSSEYRTARFRRPGTREAVGDTQPVYAGNVEKHGASHVGIVYTGNYAAMKDNAENNTLLAGTGW